MTSNKWMFALLMASLLTAGCSNQTSGAQERKSEAAPKNPGEVSLSTQQQRESGFEYGTARPEEASELITLPGRITLADDSSWHVGVVSSGRVEQVLVNVGDSVQKGQVLARMHSHDVHEARAAYLSAKAELAKAQAAAALAQRNRERTQRLLDLKAASLEEFERAKQEGVNADTAVRDAQIDLERERVHLQETLGVPAEGGHGDDAELIPIRAPGSGHVLKRDISPGEMADPSKDAFLVGDIRHLWLIASANENSMAQLKVGQPVVVSTRAFPGEEFKGKITNVGQQLDPATRVLPVRVDLDNPNQRLRPEMLANAQVAVGRTRSVIVVPSEAVQQMNDQEVVFVRKGPEHFELRYIKTGETGAGQTRVLEGLQPNEAVVTKGSFALKSMLLKAELQGGE